jgi:hypothetical protein
MLFVPNHQNANPQSAARKGTHGKTHSLSGRTLRQDRDPHRRAHAGLVFYFATRREIQDLKADTSARFDRLEDLLNRVFGLRHANSH